ncbi:XRE family transcriptional regulator [Latilactobacillus fuchuensis]|uniref:XRE family transcriptional regulator n=1 Tax=Latilactobacillus fuchuensis TaxID=164393 RepID=UPI0039B04AEA
MNEQALLTSAKEVEKSIKISLLTRGMSQRDLSDLIGERPTQVNRAIKGDMSPKSIRIREKIYTVLNIEE